MHDRLRAIGKLARAKGLESLDPATDAIIRIGSEVSSDGLATTFCLGASDLERRAEEHPEWPAMINAEIAEIRDDIKSAQGARVRFVIWAGAGGPAEDKAMFSAVGLLKRTPRCFLLDSTDPAKLKSVFDEIARKTQLRIPDILRSTLVVGSSADASATGPVVNLERLAALYGKHRIDNRSNFVAMALPGSRLDKFAAQQGFRQVRLQPDNADSKAECYGGPLTRSSLYPLGMLNEDLGAWIGGAILSAEQIAVAWRLAAFLHSQCTAGRNKITLVLPKPWLGVGPWTKQRFEASLGKCGELGLKIVLEDRIKLANYRSPKDAGQDRAFMSLKVRGFPKESPDKVGMLRRSGYPVASLTLPKDALLSTYMQFVHYVVFGVAYLGEINLAVKPGAEQIRSITRRLVRESERAGGVEKCEQWRKSATAPQKVKHRGCVTLCYDRLRLTLNEDGLDAPAVYAAIVKKLLAAGKIEYAGLTFFGDTRYSPPGRSLRKVLNRSAEKLFRSRLKIPVDINEGPAANNCGDETVIGCGKCLSTLILPEKPTRYTPAGSTAQHHRAQFLATQIALQQRSRPVVSILLKDLDEATLVSLEDFFRQAAASLKSVKI